MSNNVFIPLTDDLLVRHPELRNAHLVPYQPGVTIWRVVELDEDEGEAEKAGGRGRALDRRVAAPGA